MIRIGMMYMNMNTMMMMVMMAGILGLREMIRIGMRYMNRIFLLKIMIFLRLPWEVA
jgi:hypothetical protein